jgi:hypothetical protein
VVCIHHAYSNTSLLAINKKLRFPFDDKDGVNNYYDKLMHHESSKLNKQKIDRKIDEYILSKSDDERWKRCVSSTQVSLNEISVAIPEQLEFNEATRRLIINPIVLALCSYNKKKLRVEFDWSKESKNFTSKELLFGNGPLDYLIGPIAVNFTKKTNETTTIKNDSEEAIKMNSDEEQQDDLDGLLDVEAKVECNEKNLFQLLAQIHDNMFLDSLNDDNKNLDLNDSKTNNKNKLISNFTTEANKKQKISSCEFDNLVAHTKKSAFGVLCTGSTWQFYNISSEARNEKALVQQLAVLKLPVLKYILDDSKFKQRDSGASQKAWSSTDNVVKMEKVERVMAALQVLNEFNM